MDLIPSWFNQLPIRFRRPSELFNVGKLFDGLDLGTTSSGVSISSDDQQIFIEAHVPGLAAKDINVTIDENNVLWIKGSKKEEQEDKKRRYYSHSQTSFSYCLPLWDEVDHTKQPEASCKDGIMYLTFHKIQPKGNGGRRIEVKEKK